MGKDGDGKRKKDVLNMQELDTSKNRRSDARASVGELSPSAAMDVSSSAVHVRAACTGYADGYCGAHGLAGAVVNPWLTFYAPPSPPEWLGDSRIHILSDEEDHPAAMAPEEEKRAYKRKEKLWRPWTIVRPGSETERLMQSLGYVWEFPK